MLRTPRYVHPKHSGVRWANFAVRLLLFALSRVKAEGAHFLGMILTYEYQTPV